MVKTLSSYTFEDLCIILIFCLLMCEYLVHSATATECAEIQYRVINQWIRTCLRMMSLSHAVHSFNIMSSNLSKAECSVSYIIT